jgi:hypothetical protein
MLKWMLAAGAAALAITTPALAEKGGKGGDHDRQGGHSVKAERGGGGQRPQVRAERRGGNDRAQRVQLAQREDRGKGGGNDRARTRDDHPKGHENVRAERREDRGRQATARVDRRENRVQVVNDNRRGRDAVRLADRNDNRVRVNRFDRDNDGVRFVPRWNDNGLVRGFVDGCPPGLAKKGNGCLPPGQAKKLVGTRLSPLLASSLLEGPYRQWYRDDDRSYYRWDDDYIYRVRRDGDLIDAFFPYTNRDYYYYPVGLSYPDSYNYYNVPYQYRSYYPDSSDSWYRYGDGAIYQVNPSNGLISGIVALLAGDLSVGQPMPPAYSVYNVPFDYRDRYYDTPNDWYRYNDGYIYRVDPTTQLVTAVINAIV